MRQKDIDVDQALASWPRCEQSPNRKNWPGHNLAPWTTDCLCLPDPSPSSFKVHAGRHRFSHASQGLRYDFPLLTQPAPGLGLTTSWAREPWTTVSRFSPTHAIALASLTGPRHKRLVDLHEVSLSLNTASSTSSDRDRDVKNSFATRNTRYMTTHALGQSKSKPYIRMFHRPLVTSNCFRWFRQWHAH